MTVFNATAAFAGAGSAVLGASHTAIVDAVIFLGAGALSPYAAQKFTTNPASFKGVGLLDPFRISNYFAYDPMSSRQRVMQLRHARLSYEGSFGDD